MTILEHNYIIITPRADNTGPTNVAVDIGRAAIRSGYVVTLLYLSGQPSRTDLDTFHQVRKFRFGDLFNLSGIVHSHGMRPDFVGWLLSWSGKCKIITTMHQHCPHHMYFDNQKWKVNLAWMLWAKALERFDNIFCI
jgi:hypothetical protein